MLQATTWSCIAQLSASLEMTAFQAGFLAVIGIRRVRPPGEIKLIHNQSHTLCPGLEQQDFSRQLYFFGLLQHRIILYPLLLVAELQ